MCSLFPYIFTVINKGTVLYCKSGNFHVEIIHVVNIHVDLFLWVYGTHENILTWTYFNTNI